MELELTLVVFVLQKFFVKTKEISLQDNRHVYRLYVHCNDWSRRQGFWTLHWMGSWAGSGDLRWSDTGAVSSSSPIYHLFLQSQRCFHVHVRLFLKFWHYRTIVTFFLGGGGLYHCGFLVTISSGFQGQNGLLNATLMGSERGWRSTLINTVAVSSSLLGPSLFNTQSSASM